MKKTSQQIFNFKRISSFKSSLALVGLVVMAGCNGGGAANTEVAGLESDLMTGQFIDGPVRGVKYECSSGRFGVTNSQGQYTCKKNDTVSFKVDNVILGTADAEAILTPVSLSPEETEVAVNIAQLLQTLDDDGDLSSFVIDDEKAALLNESLDVTSASFDTDAGTMLSIPLVDEGSAIAHLNESITTLTTMEPISLTPTSVIEPIAALPETKSLTLATPSSLNPISNGTFDTDVMGWTGNNGTVSHASAINGRDNVLAIADNNAEHSSATQSFSTVVGRQYEVVGLKYYNGNLIECDLRIFSGQWSAALGDLLNVAMPKSPTWETLATQTFTATSTMTTVALMSRGTNTAYFDDVLVRPVATQAVPTVTEPTPVVESAPTSILAEPSTQTTINPYLEKVTPPECDASNPEVQLISTNADWSHINDAGKRIFCVSPGNYTSLGTITLSRSGTMASPRYIVLNNGNDTHPAKLQNQEIANFKLTFNKANYWVIDRMSTNNSNDTYVMMFLNSSNHNIINRSYFNNNFGGINITHLSDNNTIQHTRISNMTLAGRKKDKIAIRLSAPGLDYVEVKNTKIIENEIVNTNDAFQAVRHNSPSGFGVYNANYEGTVVDSNHMYITSSIYTDGNGNLNPNGKYAYAENAIDLKAGSENAKNPMIITNNHFWGYRKSDKTDSQLNDWGNAVVIHWGTKNLLFKNNYVFNSTRGVGVSDKNRFPHSISDSEISNNTFFNNGVLTSSTYEFATYLLEGASNVKFNKNNIIGTKIAKWFSTDATTVNSEISCNIIINSLEHTGTLASSNMISRNVYFNTKPLKQDTDYISDPDVTHALLEDYSFTTDRFTNNPRNIILKNAISKAQRPSGCSN